MFEKLFHVAMRGDKAVRPEGDSAFIQTILDLTRRRLENCRPGNHHLKFAVYSTQTRKHAFSHFADRLTLTAARLTFSGDTVLGEACWTQLTCQRRRASAIADDFDLLVLHVNVLQVAVIYTLLAELRQQQNCEDRIEITQSGRAMAILKHHALCKAGRRIVIAKARERLDCVEVKFLLFHDLLQREIKTDRPLIDYRGVGHLAKQLLKSWRQGFEFLTRDLFRRPDHGSSIP